MVSVHTKLISLLGFPLEQTLAPQMFNETFRILNLDYFYFPIEIGNDKLEAVVNGIRCMNYAGFNVTKPNKIKILDYLDELDELAEIIGSVNVVTMRNGKLKGYNTDGIGFVQALLDQTSMDLSTSTFLILGAGGASRAVSSTLASQGAKKLHIVDKIDEASASLVKNINRKIRECAEFIPFDKAPLRELMQKSNVLVNATGVGMPPDIEHTPVNKEFLHKDLLVCDLIYNPLKTRLLLDAEEAGCRTMNGIDMAIIQGIKGFALMTGLPEPAAIMRETMYKLIADR
ncbi:MAG: shikimate dehydrogenase [Spirochaetaceae bacterium]|nr:MAG: shikimate dehydrogenase [Spirochaetaceae bacterium]